MIKFVLIVAILASNGCALLTRHQLKGKVPRVNAAVYSAELNTIYGASGTLKETDIKWDGDVKTVGTSDLRVTSPFGGFSEHIEKATFGATQQPAPSK